MQLKDVKPDGRYTIVFSANSFDTSGEPPPLLTSNTVQLRRRGEDQAGVPDSDVPVRRQQAARRAAVRGRGAATSSSAWTTSPPTYKRVQGRLTPQDRKVVETCIRSQIGTGPRRRGRARRSGSATRSRRSSTSTCPSRRPRARSPRSGSSRCSTRPTPAVQALGSLGTLKLVFATDLFNEPSADGAVRLQDGAADGLGPADQRRRAEGHGARDHEDDREEDLPGQAQGHVREVEDHDDAATSGWTSRPARRRGQVTFRSDYGYETGLATEKTIQVPCPRFQQ